MRAKRVVLVLAALAVVLPAAVAEAHFDSREYSWSKCSDGNRIDPIGIVFYRHAHGRTTNHVEEHTAWDINDGSIATQYFGGHGECGAMDAQRANGTVAETRYHLRAWRAPYHDDPPEGRTVTSTPHFEDIVDCDESRWDVDLGHAVREDENNWSGFDMARVRMGDRLAEFDHHNPWVYQNWGNDAPRKQCDEQYASSRGYVRFIPIPNSTHD